MGNFKSSLTYFAKDKPPTLALGCSEQKSKGAVNNSKRGVKPKKTTTTTTPTLTLGGSEQRPKGTSEQFEGCQ